MYTRDLIPPPPVPVPPAQSAAQQSAFADRARKAAAASVRGCVGGAGLCWHVRVRACVNLSLPVCVYRGRGGSQGTAVVLCYCVTTPRTPRYTLFHTPTHRPPHCPRCWPSSLPASTKRQCSIGQSARPCTGTTTPTRRYVYVRANVFAGVSVLVGAWGRLTLCRWVDGGLIGVCMRVCVSMGAHCIHTATKALTAESLWTQFKAEVKAAEYGDVATQMRGVLIAHLVSLIGPFHTFCAPPPHWP